MIRQRQTPFQNPILPDLDLEFDPEREFWVPNRRDRVFLPSITIPKIHLVQWDLKGFMDAALKDLHAARRLSEDRWEGFCDDCSPSRSQYLGIPRDFQVPVTYNDVKRSETPVFRSSWQKRNLW